MSVLIKICNMKNKILYSIFIILLSSCNVNNDIVREIDITSEAILDNISLIDDSFYIFYDDNNNSLLISQMNGEYSVKRISLNSGKIDNIIRVGRGRDEYLHLFVNGIDKDGNFYASNNGHILRFTNDGTLLSKHISTSNLSKINRFKNGYVGITNYLHPNRIFTLCNDNGEEINYFGEFPDDGISAGKYDKMMAYQGTILTNDNRSKVAFVSSAGRVFDIYNLDNDNNAEIVYRLREDLPNYERQKGGGIGVRKISPTFYFVNAYNTDDRIYILYSGIKPIDGDVKSYIEASMGNKIQIYDWRGNHLLNVKTDIKLVSICVSNDDKYIFATYHNDEGEIKLCRFDISQI